MKNFIAACACLVLAFPLPAQAPAIEKVPVLLDTDLGSDIDDAFALALILASPELDLRGVTTVGGDTKVRAMMLCRFLTMTGRRQTRVAAGTGDQPARRLPSSTRITTIPTSYSTARASRRRIRRSISSSGG